MKKIDILFVCHRESDSTMLSIQNGDDGRSIDYKIFWRAHTFFHIPSASYVFTAIRHGLNKATINRRMAADEEANNRIIKNENRHKCVSRISLRL